MDTLSPQHRSRVMRRIKGRDTRPEMLVRRYLWHRGYRYRKNYPGLPGKPDLVLPKYGTVIFVNGCFWHGHSTHMRWPESNADFWRRKITKNIHRDALNRQQLKRLGWSVMVVWECQLTPARRQATLREIESHLNATYLRRRYQALPLAAEPTHPYGNP